MSEYFRVLKRIEEQRPRPQRAPVGPRPAVEPPQPRRSPAKWTPVLTPTVELVPATIEHPRLGAMPPRTASAYAALLDNLRNVAPDLPTRTIIFAAASIADDVAAAAVTAQLAAEAEHLGLEMLVAELSDAGIHPILRRRAPRSDIEEEPLRLDLHGGSGAADVARWLNQTAPHADLRLIVAPALADTLNAVSLARLCGGLVIVAQAEITRRETLQLAVERARAADCPLLGIVVHGAKHRVPEWLRTLTQARRPVPTEVEQ